MLRFLVDECLPRTVSRSLSAAGYHAMDVRDTDLRGQSDQAIHKRAVEEALIVVTADLDFSNALRFPPGSHPGIIVLRVPGEWLPSRQAERVVAGIGEVGEKSEGAIVIIEADRVRIFEP